MIYLKLFYKFLIIGILSIGGGYTAIPLIKDVALDFSEKISDEMISNFIAISESTPGSIAVNLATFVGSEEAGLLGGIIATLAVILPAFVIILLFAVYFTKFLEYDKVKRVFDFIRPCIVGIIMSVGIEMLYSASITSGNSEILKAILVTILIIVVMFMYKKIVKKKLSAIPLIVIGAILGIAINLIM